MHLRDAPSSHQFMAPRSPLSHDLQLSTLLPIVPNSTEEVVRSPLNTWKELYSTLQSRTPPSRRGLSTPAQMSDKPELVHQCIEMTECVLNRVDAAALPPPSVVSVKKGHFGYRSQRARSSWQDSPDQKLGIKIKKTRVVIIFDR